MGPRILIEENSRAISDNELNIVVAEADANAEAYERILYEYLDDNKDTFTAWRDATDKNRNTYLPKITAVGRQTREEKLLRRQQFYNKESD